MTWEQIFDIIQGQATPEEQRTFHVWFNACPQNQTIFFFLKEQHQRLQKPVPTEMVDREWERLQRLLPSTATEEEEVTSGKEVKLNWYKACLKYAAVVALVVLTASGFWFLTKDAFYGSRPSSATAQYSTHSSTTQRKEVALPDGSVVTLARHSSIRYRSDFNSQHRNVILQGEAFFQVHRNPQKPFEVETEGLKVKVLGTSFHVYSQPSHTAEVTVATGLVAVKTGQREEKLRPNQRLTYNYSTHTVSVTKVSSEEAQSLRTGTLCFRQSNLTDISKQLERWFKLKVSVKVSAKNTVSFTGTIQDAGLHQVLEGLSFATGYQFVLTKHNTILIQ